MNVSELSPNPANPRQISDEKLSMLKDALKEFGDLSGIVFNRRTKQLVGGHQRVKVLPKNAKVTLSAQWNKPTKTGTIATGFIEIEGEHYTYREVDWDETKEKAANIAANQHGGEWDLPKLRDWLVELKTLDYPMDLTGFASSELESLIAPIQKIEPGCDENEIPEALKEAKTEPGDLFQMGPHRLLCGDSTQLSNVEKLLGGQKPDMAFTSPPYNVGIAYNGHDDQMPEDAYWDLIRQVVTNIWAVARSDIWMLWNVGASASAGFDRHMGIIRDAGFKIDRAICWKKKGITGPPIFSHTQEKARTKYYLPFFGWEFIFACYQSKGPGKRSLSPELLHRRMTDVWEVDQSVDSNDQSGHPAAFPVALASDAIALYADDLVFEPFGGSGSTLIACEKTGRACAIMEKDPLYCDVILARWEKYTGKKAERGDG